MYISHGITKTQKETELTEKKNMSLTAPCGIDCAYCYAHTPI